MLCFPHTNDITNQLFLKNTTPIKSEMLKFIVYSKWVGDVGLGVGIYLVTASK